MTNEITDDTHIRLTLLLTIVRMTDMDTLLDKAIERAGGVGALAKALGIKNPNVISNWRSRNSVPLPWSMLIRQFLERQRATDKA